MVMAILLLAVSKVVAVSLQTKLQPFVLLVMKCVVIQGIPAVEEVVETATMCSW